MFSSEMIEINQGKSISRPPLFFGSNFSHWKRLMQIWLMNQDYELWNIVSKTLIRIMHTLGTE